MLKPYTIADVLLHHLEANFSHKSAAPNGLGYHFVTYYKRTFLGITLGVDAAKRCVRLQVTYPYKAEAEHLPKLLHIAAEYNLAHYLGQVVVEPSQGKIVATWSGTLAHAQPWNINECNTVLQALFQGAWEIGQHAMHLHCSLPASILQEIADLVR